MKPLPGEGLPGADPFTAIRDQISGRAYSNQEFLAFRYQGMDPGDAVQDLVTHFNLDPALAETYGSNYADVFATGLPATDNVAKTRLDGGRKKVIVKIADDFGALMTHKPLEDSTIARAAEDKDIQLSLAARQGGKQLEAFLSKSTGKSWLRDKQAIKDAGFFRSAMFSAAWSAIALDYYPESELPESAVPVESIPEGDINYLYAGEPVPRTLSMEAITEQRRKHNQVDLSQERLDERLRLLMDGANVEMAAFAMGDLRRMASFGGSYEKRANDLFTLYRDALMGPNLYAKGELMQLIAESYADFAVYARGGRNTQTVKALMALSGAALGVNQSLEESFELMARIYTNLGYDVPESLQDFVPTPEQPTEDTHASVPIESLAVETAETKAEAETPAEVSEERIAVDGAVRYAAQHLLERLTVNRLDKIILPADMHKFEEGLREEIAKTTRGETGMQGEILEKVVDIATLCMNNGGELHRSKGGRVKAEDLVGLDLTDEQRERLLHQQALPYFVAVFQLPDGGRAVFAERERYGFATIAVNETQAGTHWHAALMRYRLGIQQPGVTRIIHSPAAPFGEKHRAKMSDLLTSWQAEAI